MLVAAFAPMLLNLVGHGTIELHRLLIDLQVQAFAVSQPLRGALGYSATAPASPKAPTFGALPPASMQSYAVC